MSIINVKNQSHHTIYILRKDIRVGMVQKMTIFPYYINGSLLKKLNLILGCNLYSKSYRTNFYFIYRHDPTIGCSRHRAHSHR